MPVYIPARKNGSGSGGVSGDFVTINTDQGIYGEKTFYANVEFAVSGDAAILFDTYAPSSYSEAAWGFRENPSFGLYASFDTSNAPSWTINSSGQYWSLFGYNANKDLFTIDIYGNAVLSNGNLSLLKLNPATSGNILTWDNTGKIKDSGIPINEFDQYSNTTSLSASNSVVNYTGSGGDTFILPPASSLSPKSVIITVKHSGSGNLNIAPYDSEIIDDLSPGQTILMIKNQSLTFISNTINKYIIT